MYKAIFLDMDGTLLNSNKDISERTKQILLKIKKKGIEIVLASGRCNKSMEYIAKNRINIKDDLIRYIISTDGTMIKDLKENKIIYQNSLSEDIVQALILNSQKFDTAFYLITENNMYSDKRRNKSQEKYDELYINKEFYKIENNIEKIDFKDFNFNNEKVNRILFFSKDFEALNNINKKLQEKTDIKTSFKKDNKDNYYLLLVSNEYSKAMGVIKLCKHLDIDIKNTIAFGDGDNDIEMLETVANGIGMKNANCDLKTDKITEFTNDEDGVARYLERMIQNGEI